MASAELLAVPISDAVEAIARALLANCKILACGVGVSASDAQHFVAALVGRFERDRPELAALALGTDHVILTAVADDVGFDQAFAKQIRALGQAGDVLLALSTTGDTASVVQAVAAAHERDLRVIALTGKGGGLVGASLRTGDVAICVPDSRTARIQEIHGVVLHCLCDGIDYTLMGEEP